MVSSHVRRGQQAASADRALVATSPFDGKVASIALQDTAA